MLETYFSASKMLGHLRSGPSGSYLDDFAAALERHGYSATTAVGYLRAAAHLGHVMAERGDAMESIVPPHLRRGAFQPSDKLIALLKRAS